MSRKAWDEERARGLLAEGKTNFEVAEMVGISVATLSAWKKREGLTQTRSRKRPSLPGTAEETRAKTETVVSLVKAPASTPNIPARKIPVEISFSIDGCTVSMSAPDIERALWADGYMHHLLADLRAVLDGKE
jgi:hypothetical protein